MSLKCSSQNFRFGIPEPEVIGQDKAKIKEYSLFASALNAWSLKVFYGNKTTPYAFYRILNQTMRQTNRFCKEPKNIFC